MNLRSQFFWCADRYAFFHLVFDANSVLLSSEFHNFLVRRNAPKLQKPRIILFGFFLHEIKKIYSFFCVCLCVSLKNQAGRSAYIYTRNKKRPLLFDIIMARSTRWHYYSGIDAMMAGQSARKKIWWWRCRKKEKKRFNLNFSV